MTENPEQLFERYNKYVTQRNALDSKARAVKAEIETMFLKHIEIAGDDIEKPILTYACFNLKKTFRLSKRTRKTETVTKEGKSFIKIHANPEMIKDLIRTSETEYVEIRENATLLNREELEKIEAQQKTINEHSQNTLPEGAEMTAERIEPKDEKENPAPSG
jgi:hypothetical protein